MLALARHCARAILLSVMSVLVLATGAAVVRLLPWLLSPEVPLLVALPFAKALWAVALEASFLVGVPAGCAFGAALLVERGELRALASLGASPFRLAAGVAAWLAPLAVLALSATLAWQAGIDQPGRFARSLIERARNGCDAGGQRSVAVPVVGVTWLCFEGRPPRVTGPVPNSGERAWFSAASISLSDDFTAFRARDVYVGSVHPQSKFRLGLRVKSAHVSGLPAWGNASASSSVERAVAVALVVLLLGVGSVWGVLGLAIHNRPLAGGYAGLAGLICLRVLHASGAAPERVIPEVLAVGLAFCVAPVLLALVSGKAKIRGPFLRAKR